MQEQKNTAENREISLCANIITPIRLQLAVQRRLYARRLIYGGS